MSYVETGQDYSQTCNSWLTLRRLPVSKQWTGSATLSRQQHGFPASGFPLHDFAHVRSLFGPQVQKNLRAHSSPFLRTSTYNATLDLLDGHRQSTIVFRQLAILVNLHSPLQPPSTAKRMVRIFAQTSPVSSSADHALTNTD